MLIAPEKALKLVTNDYMRQYLKKENEPLPMWKEIVAGGTAGLAQSVLSTPMDLLKINMQDAGRLAALSNSKIKAIPARSVLKKVLKNDGFFTLFRGLFVTGGRNIFFSIVYFPVFFAINELHPNNVSTCILS